jgi:hypothetical protein
LGCADRCDDRFPDYAAKTLPVEIHRLGSALQDAAVAQLCVTLTATDPKPD